MDDILTCSICREIFLDVIEAPCCNTCYCMECLSEWVERSKNCPNCRSGIASMAICKPNIPFQRLVNNMPIKCEHTGCSDALTRGIIKEHMKNCGFGPAECDLGKQACPGLKKNTLEAHKLTCPFRPRQCPLCAEILKDDDHISVCPMVEIDCPQGCKERIQRAKSAHHLKAECALSSIPCPYAEHGCPALLKRTELKDHKKANTLKHFQLLEASFKKFKQDHKKLIIETRENKQELVDLRAAVQTLSALKPQLPYNPYHYLPVVLSSSLLDQHKKEFLSVDNLTIRTIKTAGSVSSLGQSFLFSGFQQSEPIRSDYAAVIPGNKIIPEIKYLLPYYFEITVLSSSGNDHVSIGFVKATHSMKGRIGETPNSWGFHLFENTFAECGQDGKVIRKNSGTVLNRSGKNIVGCCYINGFAFFTINGKQIDSVAAFSDLPRKFLFPAIGVEGSTIIITVNFGAEPFACSLGTKELINLVPQSLCTFNLTKDKYADQMVFLCKTCGYTGDFGVCSSCAKKCHKGHELVPIGVSVFFCDCGLPVKEGAAPPMKCSCRPNDKSPR